ncbi:uncharacterized protein LOC143791853 [Ranitomeya variabilis]|uniref:uncharacterized protein LOC143791853 n=1 Tax=Ranitomeya variabilis TaxID=490064 RepID=UPI004056073D
MTPIISFLYLGLLFLEVSDFSHVEGSLVSSSTVDPNVASITTEFPVSTADSHKETTIILREKPTDSHKETSAIPREKATDSHKETSESPKEKPTDSHKETSASPREKPTDSHKETTIILREKPTDSHKETSAIPREKATDSHKETSESPKEKPTDSHKETSASPREKPTDTAVRKEDTIMTTIGENTSMRKEDSTVASVKNNLPVTSPNSFMVYSNHENETSEEQLISVLEGKPDTTMTTEEAKQNRYPSKKVTGIIIGCFVGLFLSFIIFALITVLRKKKVHSYSFDLKNKSPEESGIPLNDVTA